MRAVRSPVMNTYETRTRRWTRTEYDRLIELGVFEADEHLELIGGELIAGEPHGAEHYTAICMSTKALEAAFGPGWVVQPQGASGWTTSRSPSPTSPSCRVPWTTIATPTRPSRSSFSRWRSRASASSLRVLSHAEPPSAVSL